MIKNYITICCQGDQIERFINLCSFHDIWLWNIRKEDHLCYINLYPEDFFRLKEFVKKTKIRIRIVEKKGIVFWLKIQFKRKMYLLAPFICIFLLWTASHFLWSVRTEGNLNITDNMIESFLKQSGVYYGMPLEKIPIKDLKADMRKLFPQITWVSMKLSGTCLEISIKENFDHMVPETKDYSGYHMVAVADGIIDSLIVREGTARVKEGDMVTKGEVIIEGKIEIPGQDGTIKDTRYCKASGDVWILHSYPINEKIIYEHNLKQYTGKEMEKFLVYNNNWAFALDIRKIPYITYDYLEETINIPLLKFLSLPIEVKKITYRDYIVKKEKYTKQEAQRILSKRLNKILLSLEEKGVQIIEKNVKIKDNNAYMSLSGDIMIKELCNDLKYMEEIQ